MDGEKNLILDYWDMSWHQEIMILLTLLLSNQNIHNLKYIGKILKLLSLNNLLKT